MDPGNWATDLAAGSAFGYRLLAVVLLSSLMAIVLQALAARLGIATGRDLAQACRDRFSPPVSFALWVLAEIGICACDLAELLGTALGLKLLLGIPLLLGVCLTTLDVMLVLALQRMRLPTLEAVVVSLLILVGACFAIQVALARPEWRQSRRALSRAAARRRPAHALSGHRHPGRDDHAAQSLSPFVDRADAPL
jgi:manganese transport protein